MLTSTSWFVGIARIDHLKVVEDREIARVAGHDRIHSVPQERSRQQRCRDSLAATPVTFQQVQGQLQRTTIERKTINVLPSEVSLGEGESRRHTHGRVEASLVCYDMHKLVKHDSCQRNRPVIVAEFGQQVCPDSLASRQDGQVGMN